MRLPVTLSLYIGRQFLAGVALVFSVITTIILLFDTLETIRRASGKDIPFGIILQMVLLRFPHLAQEIIPFCFLVGGIVTFSRLTRSCELIVTRASGVSAWQFLMPAVIAAFTFGVFLITIFNPLSSIMLTRFEQLEARYIRGTTSLLSVSSSGLWLKEKNADGTNSIIHALRVSQQDITLEDVTIFIFDKDNRFLRRIDADSSKLKEGYWNLKNAMLTSPDKPAQHIQEIRTRTAINLNQLQDSFASPDTISFWELPEFIRMLKAAGFSALRHTLHWQSLLVSPLLLCAMVFIAASFSLRPPRKGRTGMMISTGIIVGFLIYFASDLVAALGLSGNIPITLAAVAPVAISVLLGTAMMLHLEDG